MKLRPAGGERVDGQFFRPRIAVVLRDGRGAEIGLPSGPAAEALNDVEGEAVKSRPRFRELKLVGGVAQESVAEDVNLFGVHDRIGAGREGRSNVRIGVRGFERPFKFLLIPADESRIVCA